MKSGFITVELSKTSVVNIRNTFDELALRCYLKAVPYKVYYNCKQFLRLYIEFFQFLSNLALARHPSY